MSTKRIVYGLILIFGILLLVTGFRNGSSSTSTDTTNGSNQTASDITTVGVEGKTALEVLQATHTVKTQTYNSDEYVISIDGVEPDTSHFWAYYINGEMAQVASSSYKTKATDTITWKLDKFQE